MTQRRPQDWGAEEKLEAILEYERTPEDQRGAFLREKGLHEATLERWKKETLQAMKRQGSAGDKKDPQRRRVAALERELRRKEAALAEATALLVLKKKADALWGGVKGREIALEDRLRCRELIEEAVASGARLWKACEVLEISVRSYQRWARDWRKGHARGERRMIPANRLSEEERAAMLAIATAKRFRDLPPSQIVPILAEEGVYVASEASFYRLLMQEKLLAHREGSRARQHSRPEEQVATGPNQVWSWDITYLRSPVRGQFYYLYLVVDVWSRMVVAWRVEDIESSEIAAQMIHQACLCHGMDRDQLVIHSDNGGPMKGATLLAMLQVLGILPSFSRPRVSDDNPYSEALFRTLKYRPEYPGRPFESLQEATAWVQGFVRWYNQEHRHSGIKFVTSASRHNGEAEQILMKRKEVYEEAKRRIPSRWSGNTRNWEPVEEVRLNASDRKGDRQTREQRRSA